MKTLHLLERKLRLFQMFNNTFKRIIVVLIMCSVVGVVYWQIALKLEVGIVDTKSSNHDESFIRPLFGRIFPSKAGSCGDLLSMSKELPLDEDLINELLKACVKKEQATTEMLFSKELLQKSSVKFTCPETKPTFANKSGPFVALASFQGSGNTWTRVLLEAITGIYTGSVYSDKAIYMPGSLKSPCSHGVFMVKTHKVSDVIQRRGCPDETYISAAILVLRNPYNAIMAEYNRRHSGSNVKYADEKEFYNPQFQKSAISMSHSWLRKALWWLYTFKGPVHVLVYEALKENTMFEMYKVMKFLGREVTLEKLYCLVNDSHDKYYRGKDGPPAWLDKTKLFNNRLKTHINKQINEFYANISTTNKMNSEVFKTYILPVHDDNATTTTATTLSTNTERTITTIQIQQGQ